MENATQSGNLIVKNVKIKERKEVLNKVELIGNIGTIRKFETGVSFSIATTRNYKSNNEWKNDTTWHNVTMFSDDPNELSERYSVGDLMYVEGRLDYRVKDKTSYTSIIAGVLRRLHKRVQAETTKGNEGTETKPVQEAKEDDLPF